MTLGIALVIIFVLYLIDKHNRWTQTLKLVVAMAVVAGLLFGSMYAYTKYEAWRVTRCVAKSTPAGNATAAAETEAACERDPSKPLVLDMSKAISRHKLQCSKNGKLQPDFFAEFGGVITTCAADETPMLCGLDAAGHIVPDGKGGCILPPPDGYTIDVPK
jgi:hypothetical protein